MMESKGTSITTGNLKEGKPVDLQVGQELMILIDFAVEGDNTKITTSYKELTSTVVIGSSIVVSLEESLTDFARMEVIEVQDNIGVKVVVREGGRIGEKEIMKLPGASL
jgi:pyruvate kinase